MQKKKKKKPCTEKYQTSNFTEQYFPSLSLPFSFFQASTTFWCAGDRYVQPRTRAGALGSSSGTLPGLLLNGLIFTIFSRHFFNLFYLLLFYFSFNQSLHHAGPSWSTSVTDLPGSLESLTKNFTTVHHAHAWWLQRPEEDLWRPRTGVTDSCELTLGSPESST